MMKAQEDSFALLVVRLRRHCLFEGMSAEETAAVAERLGGGLRRFKKGAEIIREGSGARWLVPVISGLVNVYETMANGERHLVRAIEAGALFGTTFVTQPEAKYPCSLVATQACEVVFFDLARIRELWHEPKYKRFFENLYMVVSGYVLYCTRKLSLMASKTTEEKFLFYLGWYASDSGSNDVTLPFARAEDCAAFLGVTRVSLHRAIRHLEESGRIRHVGRAHFVLNSLRP